MFTVAVSTTGGTLSKPVLVQAFVAEAPVEELDVGVLVMGRGISLAFLYSSRSRSVFRQCDSLSSNCRIGRGKDGGELPPRCGRPNAWRWPKGRGR